MVKLARRSAAAHWRRYALTSVAALLGVAFVVGAFAFTDTVATSIDRLLAADTANSDLIVRASGEGGLRRAAALGGLLSGDRSGVPAALADRLRSLPDVAAVEVSVGGPVELASGTGALARLVPTELTNWPARPEGRGLVLLAGRAPRRADDVVIDDATARARHLAVGTRVRVGTRRGIVTLRVSGLAGVRPGHPEASGPLLAMTSDRAAELAATPGFVDSIAVRARGPVGAARSEVVAALGPGETVLAGSDLLADAQRQVHAGLRDVVVVILGFAGVTLFVTGILVSNTFAMVTAERTSELASLRALGASRAQVMILLVAESASIGVVAAGLGLLGGIGVAAGLRRLVQAVGVHLPPTPLELHPRTVLAALTVGLGVTVLSSLLPARRGAKLPPVVAMGSPGRRADGPDRGLLAAGGVLVAAAVGVGAGAVSRESVATSDRLVAVAIAAAVALAGTAAILRSSAAVVAAGAAVSARRRSMATRLARRNLLDRRDRAGSNSSALMIGVALVVATLVVGSSLERGLDRTLTSSITADVVVQATGVVPFDARAVEAIASSPRVALAIPVAQAAVELLGPTSTAGLDPARVAPATVGDPARLATVLTPGWTSGGPPRDGRQLSLSTSVADALRVRVGDRVRIRTAGDPIAFAVSGTYRNDAVIGGVVMLPDAAVRIGADPVTRLVLVRSTGRASSTAAGLTEPIKAVPGASASTTSGFLSDRSSNLHLVLAVVAALLLMSVAVASMNIANTVWLSVVERTRQLGLLRIAGMTPPEVRRMIRAEGMIEGIAGGVAGTVLGIGFGVAVALALPTRTARLSVPLAVVLVPIGAMILGGAAATWPARRASRLEPLEAVAEP